MGLEVAMERKRLDFDAVEIKLKDESKGIFEGYASVFDGVDSYGDTIVRGAYKKTLENRQRLPQMLYNHDRNWIIGKWVEMSEDSKGLYVKGELTPGHSISSDVYASMKHGTLDGMSIGYRVPKGGMEETDDVRVLKQIDLIEVSVVTTPADDHARIQLDSVKSRFERIVTIRDVEDFLRDEGNFSKAAAQAFISRLKGVLSESAPVDVTDAVLATLRKQLNL
jgi:HK97 family phage prohead protease